MLPLHHAIVSRRATECDLISLVVGADTRKRAAPGDATFEMVDVRWFEIRTRRLVVAAILIEPGNGERIGAAICRDWLLVSCQEQNPWNYERRQSQCAGFQHLSAIEVGGPSFVSSHKSTPGLLDDQPSFFQRDSRQEADPLRIAMQPTILHHRSQPRR
jgi:hypothetical protein